ncbi:hypothetical protein [Sulfuritalea hydrogenivorans]|uniref:Uncharacterized protein n=1 Tax=Sulfuritalea hydrogenivorans sk43H TaxID=1223802 RepID=W0SHK9_9PROT|nr:hypothetical protein [Sulfuritalea hydrogenivorans]BAO29373.1 hypothetical protein SUTH_01580 [Sulfuritalea hydrogenivorans sk43H]
MAKRITITETNSPAAGFAEAFARLLVERERARPALSLVSTPAAEHCGNNPKNERPSQKGGAANPVADVEGEFRCGRFR